MNEVPDRIGRNEMRPYPLLIVFSRAGLPFPAVEIEIRPFNELPKIQAARFNLAMLRNDLHDRRLRFALCHVLDEADYPRLPDPVLIPVALPPATLLYNTSCRVTPSHKSPLCAPAITFWRCFQIIICGPRIVVRGLVSRKPHGQCLTPHKQSPAEPHGGNARTIRHLPGDDIRNVGFRAMQQRRDFGQCQQVEVCQ
jgi:hypothetical protein